MGGFMIVRKRKKRFLIGDYEKTIGIR